MTHAELVQIAAKWLRGKGCGAVLTELTSAAWETPDAIGFRSDYSILLECKVSRADFLEDKKKHFRIYPTNGQGTFRFYLCPQGVIKPDELPDKWGLIWVDENGKPRQVVGPKGNTWWHQKDFVNEKNAKQEYIILVSALRRAQESKRTVEASEEERA